MALTKAELRIASALLRMAAEEFSNHGCNDFSRPAMVTEKEWQSLLARVSEWADDFMGPGDEEEEPIEWARDDQLMDYLSDRLLSEARKKRGERSEGR